MYPNFQLWGQDYLSMSYLHTVLLNVRTVLVFI